jgi:hypothetical protein
MQIVVTALRRVAEDANCAIELVHHVRKVGDNRVKVDDSRGGSALTAETRSVRVLNRMSRDEAREWKVPDRERAPLVCIDGGGKANYAPAGAPVSWFKMESVSLGNAPGNLMRDADSVGVPVPWIPPPPKTEDEIEIDFETVRPALRGKQWRESPQATDWIGYRIAEGLGLDVKNDDAAKRKVVNLIRRWLKEGKLRVTDGKDDRRKTVPVIEVVESADELNGTADAA